MLVSAHRILFENRMQL